jgi:enoyl-CoA hydratase/carnithine racemase
MSDVEYHREGRIAYITLNRPEVLNALTDDMVGELHQALHRLDTDDDAMAAVVSGAGRAFCSGADVRQRHLRPPEELRRLGGASGPRTRTADLMYDFANWKPVIAAVHGYVLGAGVYLALASEMIVAAAGTRFQITETPRGLDATPFWTLLRHKATGAFATEVALSGRFWTAEEGLPAGAVDRVVPAGEHVAAATRLIEELILPNPPLAVRAVVELRRSALLATELENRQSSRPRRLYLTEDFRESARAFIEKRKPKFVGR